MVMIAGHVQGQEWNEEGTGNAYWDSETATYIAAAVPIGAIIITAIAIACTRGHHHHSGYVSTPSSEAVKK